MERQTAILTQPKRGRGPHHHVEAAVDWCRIAPSHVMMEPKVMKEIAPSHVMSQTLYSHFSNRINFNYFAPIRFYFAAHKPIEKTNKNLYSDRMFASQD